MEKEFQKRINEINLVLCKIKELTKKQTLNSSDTYLNILKSLIIIMLYNLSESTVRIAFQAIIDTIVNEKINYNIVTDPFKNLWIDIKTNGLFDPNASYTTYKKKVTCIVDSILKNDNYLDFDSKFESWESVYLPGGNINKEQIFKLCRKYNIDFKEKDDNSFIHYAMDEQKIVRNHLSHGNTSFETEGEKLSIQSIESSIKITVSFLTDFMDSIKIFIKKGDYKQKE
ncbi:MULTISPECIES: MAE_28990/MAE_18760 family HEPN-like nuclease [unclassified Lactobacillus]|uniref:MAE_28990/MAE_18760 family HEPN-like nuclease n=1 Tax=unclassified Lactobacillus TaxID=2620435 RepID=UPI000EFC9262|nr:MULTISPECIES: MAE_28990/MAE_18760 family HEPN-like nuclease [unclassified Lactobacillus]RMC24468.1 hypothetical protein F5ESL0247_04660 [Lactobacillus sp. ESL0247]RMC28607.1 hypothetical protein F5ESL0246_04660 [Lactobacillus sp. ESL0246]RMC31799.1 hypothetical protein F5ESL0245_04665 [Lactobacillus sp. ESL0245]